MSTNYIPANAQNAGTVAAHAVAGEPMAAAFSRPNAVGDNVQQAALFSTAPYRDPALKPKRRACSVDGCKGSPMKSIEYCVGHARSLGLVKVGE